MLVFDNHLADSKNNLDLVFLNLFPPAADRSDFDIRASSFWFIQVRGLMVFIFRLIPAAVPEGCGSGGETIRPADR